MDNVAVTRSAGISVCVESQLHMTEDWAYGEDYVSTIAGLALVA
jgi:hypothetical protein